MSTQPEDLPIHLKEIENPKGGCFIDVCSAAGASGPGNFLMNCVLESNIDEDGERISTRELGIVVAAPSLSE